MCKVTLEYDEHSAIARRKLAALMATGLFAQAAIAQEEAEQQAECETLEEHRQLRDAAMYTSHRNMERFVEKYF